MICPYHSFLYAHAFSKKGLRGLYIVALDLAAVLAPPRLRRFGRGQADRPRLTSQLLQATVPAVYAHIRGGRFAQRRPLHWPLVEEEKFGLLPVEPVRPQQSRQFPEECSAGRNLHVVTIGWVLLAVR